jgi:hypothetical protein
MFRRLSAGLLAAALAAAALPGSPAQEKKAQPKKERIAVADPEKAKADPDFLIQGEYVGESTTGSAKQQKVGAQVIAKGAGGFDVKVLVGGLPGDGWDGKTALKGTARRGEDGVTMIEGTELAGVITGGKMMLTGAGKLDAALGKVERKSKTLGEKPPPGAAALFDKPGDEANWTNGKLMDLADGKFLTVAGTRSIRSKPAFGAFKAHIEFRTPWMPNSTGQGRGNSGVYIQDRYELQVLDSFGLTGENNECGGIYTQHKPLVNMCYPPLAWQTYDIEFTAAEFGPDGKKTKNARATILHNGVKIHDNIEFPRETPGGQKEGPKPGPFQFQDHGDPVVYANVWVIETK